jgi:hypothetical protein
VPDDAVVVSRGGRRLDLDVRDLPVVDSTGATRPVDLPATVSFKMTWRATGSARRRGQGAAVAPTDPSAFVGRFYRGRVQGTFSGTQGVFTFESKPKPLRTIFAEFGAEQSGALLPGAARCKVCTPSPPTDPGPQAPW